MRSPRYPALDGLRGLAVLAVFVYHVAFFSGATGRTGLDRAVLGVALHGWLGVDLFFVLSGFLITGILLDTRDQPGAVRQFYERRIRRIVPAYFLALLVQALYYASQGRLGAVRLGWTATWLTNLLIAREGWASLAPTMQHYWSLAVEEQFYLLWPLLALFLGRGPLRWIGGLCLVGASVSRVVFAQSGNPVAGYVLLPARMDGLAVGCLLALLARGPDGLAGAARRARIPGWIAAGVLALLLARRGRLEYGDPLMLSFGMNAVVIAMGAILVHAAATGPAGRLGRVLEARPLAQAGRYSYALYLWHQPVIIALTALGLRAEALPPLLGSDLPGILLLALVAGLISLALALASWRWIESPLLTPRPAP